MKKSSKKTASYSGAGVNIIVGDDASQILYHASRATWKNRAGVAAEVNVAFDSFSALRYIDTSRFPNMVLGMNFDGVGTKIEIAERMGDHTTIAHDLFAMVCDDAARDGGEPVLLGSILDCRKIDINIIRQLAQGLEVAAEKANVSVFNGEIAELGDRVGGYTEAAYNWGAGVIWLGRKERLLSGSNINSGDSIVTIKENGFRSNGLTLVRRILAEEYGENWHNVSFEGGKVGEAVLCPSTIYTRLIVALTGGCDKQPKAEIHGIVHVTGGGIPGKLSRLIRANKLGARLNNLFSPSYIMSHCQELADVNPTEAYRTWNMGNGLLVVTPEPTPVLTVSSEMGFDAQLAGVVTLEPGINIRNQSLKNHGEWLHFAE
jgi:phosphoribosylformylglycinamidine cyclo-ligase